MSYADNLVKFRGAISITVKPNVKMMNNYRQDGLDINYSCLSLAIDCDPCDSTFRYMETRLDEKGLRPSDMCRCLSHQSSANKVTIYHEKVDHER